MNDSELFGLAGIAATAALKSSMLKGAQRQATPTPPAKFYKLDGTPLAEDFRVKLKVPGDAVSSPMTRDAPVNDPITIIFPYTPSITFDHKATYSAQTVMHSNFTQYFYQNSSVSPITISGKFTVENDTDAYYLSNAIAILRSVTKMRQGRDTNAGAPPPVCRLSAYGPAMLTDVPVVISSFKYDLPEGVDYYSIKESAVSVSVSSFPVVSTITLICNPVYSRDEMKKFNNKDWLSGILRSQGFTGYL
jgi:hypothetical protein